MRADSKNDTLVKINEAIKIFIEELNELEAQMSHVKNQGVRALLIERHDAQLEILRELMSLSEDTKRKIVQKLK